MDRKARARLAVVGLGVVGLAVGSRLLPLEAWTRAGLDAAREAGPAGVIAFSLVYAVVTVSLVPASLLTLGAGVTWGPFGGALAVWPGATLGAFLAYALARWGLRDAVARRLAATPSLLALDEAMGAEGGRVTLLLRLSPLFPFGLLNYALGLTRVGPLTYLLATAIGIVPGTLLYAWIGAAAGEVGSVAVGEASLGPRQALGAVGLVATAVATWLVTRAARRALAQRLPQAEAM